MSFKQYIVEAKNVHLVHAADLSFEGTARINQAINFIESLIEMLRGTSGSKLNVTRKWDGAPAIICGNHPETGKFFVGTKSVFNITPKIADKLKIALKHLPSLSITEVLQGDFLFDSGDLSDKTIDGEKYLTFTPNVITYAVEKGDLQDKIKGSKMGIVFHTKYTGKQLTDMKVSYSVTEADFGKSSSVWAIDAGYKDVSGKSSFTEKEHNAIMKLIQKAKTGATRAKKGSSLIATNPAISTLINIYVNMKVKEGKYSFSVREFIAFVNNRREAQINALKMEKAKDRRRKIQQIMIKTLRSRSNDIAKVFQLNKTLQKCVVIILRKLEEVKSLRTFVKTSSGYRVTGDEGFVASDKLGKAVKLVDRLEFSKTNFTTPKNWVRG
mgnify:CR=1 FL=1